MCVCVCVCAYDGFSLLRWAKDHRDELKNIASTLEFNLHRMRFIQILLSVNAIEAINYGRQNFGAFGEKHYNGEYMTV